MKFETKTIFCVLLVASFTWLTSCSSNNTDSVKRQSLPDAKAILGNWKATQLVRFKEEVDGYIGTKWKFADGKVSFDGADPVLYSIDSSKNPKYIEIGAKTDERSSRGIYKIEGNQMTLCLDSWNEPLVTQFTTTANGNMSMIVLHFQNE